MSVNQMKDELLYDYLGLFGIKGRTSYNELRIAEVKGLKASQISTFLRITGLTIYHLSIVLGISEKEMNARMRKGTIPAKDADILLCVAKIIAEFFRLYPDIQDFWLLFIASREDLNGRTALELCKTGIGRERVLAQIHKEQDEYFKSISERKKVRKPVKRKITRKIPQPLSIEDQRRKKVEEEVYRFVKEHPLEFDFSDVITGISIHGDIYEGEARGALVHLINDCKLIETPNGKIKVLDNK